MRTHNFDVLSEQSIYGCARRRWFGNGKHLAIICGHKALSVQGFHEG
jgi:hypothetical protein